MVCEVSPRLGARQTASDAASPASSTHASGALPGFARLDPECVYLGA